MNALAAPYIIEQPSQLDVFTAIRDPHIRHDPYPFFAWLREHAPVHHNPTGGVWFVSRYADALRVLRDPLFHTPDSSQSGERFARYRQFPTLLSLLEGFSAAEPTQRAQLRATAARYFTPRRHQEFRSLCARHCERLLPPIVGRLRDGATVDLHAELVYPFTWSVISDVMGVPEPERARIIELALPTLAAFNPSLADEEIQRAEEAGIRLTAYFTDLLDRRRCHGPSPETPPDLVTCLSGNLPPQQAVAVLWVIWAAGYESTVGGIISGILAMLEHPDEAHFLDGTWEQADAFVTECLRYDAPIWATGSSRVPREPVDLGGVLVPPTADLRVLVGAANRDPAAFPDPDRFQPARSSNKPPMVTFGQGPHYCLGASLARIEMTTVLTQLRRRLPHLTLAAPPRRSGTGALRRYEDLMVTL
ncbi:cytochrome P450 [Streptomyces spiramyceticus]|uniref:cytochrome P450 n=1 Tax=Streptomyces spiramyceticus TaxID=299717 RepID=UPI00237BF984|nr:cytochrome P450 [Streptomyces spiramyceticus]